MKKLKEKLALKGVTSLAGMVDVISISEFRKSPGDVFNQVEMGATFSIQRKGKTIATLCPPEPNAFELGAALRSCRHGIHFSKRCGKCETDIHPFQTSISPRRG